MLLSNSSDRKGGDRTHRTCSVVSESERARANAGGKQLAADNSRSGKETCAKERNNGTEDQQRRRLTRGRVERHEHGGHGRE